MQDSLDQVSKWCDNNHMVIIPIKTKSMTIATRLLSLPQLSALPLDLVINGAKTDKVSEHHLLGITIDKKLRWDSHTNNVCKTVSRRVFLLSKLSISYTSTPGNCSSMPTLNLTLIMRQSFWDGCGDVLKKRLSSLHRRAVNLILPDTTLTTDRKLKEVRIMSLQKQTEYNKGLFLYRVLSNGAPV